MVDRRAGTPAAASLPLPKWCVDHAFDGRTWTTRTDSCAIYTFDWTFITITNGVGRVTGRVSLNVYDWQYMSPSDNTFAHQYGLAPNKISGDGVNAILSAKFNPCIGSCRVRSSKFPTRPIALHVEQVGVAFIDSTVSAAGTSGKNATKWTQKISQVGYSSGRAPSHTYHSRCDNATAGRAGVGCVNWNFRSIGNV